jgi:ABC-2 type transport system ATP-binding protein
MIQVNELSKSFGRKKVLYAISATFMPGKVYGIVGANGAGKTTFFRCLTGLDTHGGTVSSSWQPLKDHLGFLPTQPYFLSRMTGREYLRLLCQAKGLPEQDYQVKNLFDLPLDEYAIHYSTGMKKKLALTALVLQDNDVWILDEPFNGVDIQSNLLIYEIIRRLRGRGKTLLISSHILSTLRDLCDHILVLQEGSLNQSVDQEDYEKLEKELTTQDFLKKLDALGW